MSQQNKKVILKVHLQCETAKQEAMQAVSGIQGVDSISMDMKNQKLTVIGDIDPVEVVIKLRKLCTTDILSVGLANEPEKKKEEALKISVYPEKANVDLIASAFQGYNYHAELIK